MLALLQVINPACFKACLLDIDAGYIHKIIPEKGVLWRDLRIVDIFIIYEAGSANGGRLEHVEYVLVDKLDPA